MAGVIGCLVWQVQRSPCPPKPACSRPASLTCAQPLDALTSGYGLFLSSDSTLHWAVALQSGLNVDLTAAMTIDRWTHVAGVVSADQGFAVLYVDGIAVASQRFSPSAVSYRLFSARAAISRAELTVLPSHFTGTKSTSWLECCSA